LLLAANEKTTVEELHRKIAATPAGEASRKYSMTIPGTTVSYDMVPVKGGEFEMGSSANDAEKPVHRVKIEPFWMQAHEVTWDEYRLFMFAKSAGETTNKDALVDAVSRPTKPYVEMSFGMGLNGFPAISMTQHAANKYAEWLSAKTGQFYRLPTEAEWEYACKADNTPAGKLDDVAWYGTNSNGQYQQVARKKPNAWGLYDMLGNVMEWTLDQYEPGYAQFAGKLVTAPWVRATKPYPESVRGGSWNDKPELVTCTARVASDPSWKMEDPQLPKSIWYHTDAQWLGFRLVRPVKTPAADAMYAYWNSGVEQEQ
jgi:formylglycine-generating enzyme required for sulfatase activity